MPVRGPRKPKPLGVPRGATVAAAIRGLNKGLSSSPRTPARSAARPGRAPAGKEASESSGWWDKFFETPYDFTNPQGRRPQYPADPAESGGDRRKKPRRTTDTEAGAPAVDPVETAAPEEEAPEPWHFPDVEPTATSNPLRPRTEAAGYDAANGQLYVRFRAGADKKEPTGAIYRYTVPPAIAEIYLSDLKTPSPGKFINHVLAHLPYERSSLPE